MKLKTSINQKLLFYILTTTFIVYAVSFGYIAFKTRQDSLQNAKRLADSYTRENANLTEKILNKDMAVAKTMANTFSGYDKIPLIKRNIIYNSILTDILKNNPSYISVWLQWEISSIDNQWDKPYGRIRYTFYREGELIDYYTDTLNTEGDDIGSLYHSIKIGKIDVISNPYPFNYREDSDIQVLEASLCIPIMKNGEYKGLTGIDIELEEFTKITDSIKPFEKSYAFLVANNGVLVAHPDKKNIYKKLSSVNPDIQKAFNLEDIIQNGEFFSGIYETSKDHNNYISLSPIRIGETQTPWSLGIIVPMDIITAKTDKNFYLSVLIGIIGLLILALIVWLVSRRITRPLKNTTNILENLASGYIDDSNEIIVKSYDEIGFMSIALNKLVQRLKINANFASEIGKGNLDKSYSPLSNRDILGNALLQMRTDLKELRIETENNAFAQDSIVKINQVLRGIKSMSELTSEVINILAQILNVEIAAIFIHKNDSFKLAASYAYDLGKPSLSEFKLGEGLAGQAAVEKKAIYITNIPDDYITIQSVLGKTKPSSIFIQPLIYQDKVNGIMEFGSINEIDDNKKEILNKISESIAIAIHENTTRAEMKTLLLKTQEQSEELQVQQEELREKNEELEVQTATLKASEEELQQQQEELRVTNEELQEKTHILEIQRKEVVDKNLDLENARTILEQKAKEIETASKYKSEFLANMSHELRTPLNSLLILSRNLADNEEANLDEEQIESAEIIYKSGNDLLLMINDILDLSKIEAGKMTVNIETIELKSICENINFLFKHLTDQKGIDLITNTDDDLPESVFSDQQKIEQVIKNLMSNAIKFTSEGKITVEIKKPDPKTDLSRSGLSIENSIAISVSDTGIGIPEDKQLAIFEAFQQADGSTSRNFGGTGLGLSISRELAKILGGEIQLQSKTGIGSKFTFYLPIQIAKKPIKDSPKKPDIKTIEPEKSESKITENIDSTSIRKLNIESIPDDRNKIKKTDRVILVIEDDPNFAKILYKQSHNKGFKCIAVPTGEEGLEFAQKYLPNAIILDIKLPGINGWAVLTKLKSTSSTRHIPVHMMSAEEETIDAYKKGAIGYLNKPVKPQEMSMAFDELDKFIDRKIKNLLLIEDDENLRKSIIKIIREENTNIIEADSGKKAIEYLSSTKIDCVILDLGLPDMTGFELLDKLNNEKSISIPPIIIYTGKDLSKEENQILEKYANSIILKGVKSEERLLDETSLFLHKIVSDLSDKQQEVIENLHDSETIFKNKKVLLVDDDMRNIFALSKILKKKGMEVFRAENGKIAIEILEKNTDIDIILLDVMMPVMDGYETSQKIRNIKEIKNIPIISLTAKAMKEDKQKCIDAGSNDYITKPLDIEQLLSLIRVWLHK
ncbi:MAG: response regulator [Bacteroidales bacterium]|nr:response regulator [Bacteroidales bacterium]